MFEHITLNVISFAKSKIFYEKLLRTLGYRSFSGEEGVFCGFGKDRPQFWISQGDESHVRVRGVHVAFVAQSRKQVEEFYEAGLAAGGVGNGEPGIRREYDENYYAAFIIDPDGNNIEAVTFEKE